MSTSTTSTHTTMTRTITLTGRSPVKISDADWPSITSASGDSYAGGDYARYSQAEAHGELDKWFIRVRQHEDGRALVYAAVDAADAAWGAPRGGESYRGGELLAAGEDIAAAIRRVGDDAGLPAETIRGCISGLPAEEI